MKCFTPTPTNSLNDVISYCAFGYTIVIKFLGGRWAHIFKQKYKSSCAVLT